MHARKPAVRPPGCTPPPVSARLPLKTLVPLAEAVQQFRARTFTVMYPRQAGKNEVSAVFVAMLLISHANRGGTIVLCAPTLTPQGRISMERTIHALRAMQRAAKSVRVLVDESAGVLQAGEARAVFLSASPAVHVAGHTASIALMGDEAQDIDADWFNRQFRPMAASTGAPTVLFGTAWNGRTLLETAAEANRGKWAGGYQLHYEVKWATVSKSVPAYGDYVRAERERLGAQHPLFQTQYELRSTEFADGMFNEAQLRALEGTYARLDAPVAGERYAAGLDFGGEGSEADRTVLTIARTSHEPVACEVVYFREWQGGSFATLWEELEGELRRWQPERVCADATGLGAPLIAGLEERLALPNPRPLVLEVERLPFTAQSKTELGFALLAALNAGRLSIYMDADAQRDRCRLEFSACRSELAGGATMRWGNDRGHDDYPVSGSLALRAALAAGPRRVALGRKRW